MLSSYFEGIGIVNYEIAVLWHRNGMFCSQHAHEKRLACINSNALLFQVIKNSNAMFFVCLRIACAF